MNKNNVTLPIVPIHSPWKSVLLEAVKHVQSRLFLVSPYIKKEIIFAIREALLSRRDQMALLQIQVITRTLPEEFLKGSSDIEALQQLLEWPTAIPKCFVEIRTINNVHAKVWIFDTRIAFVGSGNATPSGLAGNLEYGLAVSDTQIVTQIRHDWQMWWKQATPVTENELANMRAWLDEVKSNEDLLQIEVEAEEKRRTVERKVGVAPRIGKILPLTASSEAIISPPRSISTSDEDKQSTHRRQPLTAVPQSLWKDDPEVDEAANSETKGSLGDASGISPVVNNTEINKRFTMERVDTTHDKLLDVSSDPPWDKVLNISNSPETISQALWYHSSEILVDNGVVLSIGRPSLLAVGTAHENVTKVSAAPPEAMCMLGEHLWQTLIATFPIVDVMQANEELAYELLPHAFLQIESIRQSGKWLLQCTWSDRNRKSQATFMIVRKRGSLPSRWMITLGTQAVVTLMKGLNAALRDQWHLSTHNVYLQSSSDQLLLFYQLNPLLTKMTQNLGRLTMGLVAVPCQRVDMTRSSLSIPSHIYSFTIMHKSLVDVLLQLRSLGSTMGLSFSDVEVRIDQSDEGKQCVVTIAALGTSLSYNIPVDSHTHIESPILLRFNYISLSHIVFFSSYGVHSWRMYIETNVKKVFLEPNMISQEKPIFRVQHELQNLIKI